MDDIFDIEKDYEKYNTPDDGDTWTVFQKMIEQYVTEGRLSAFEYANIGCIWEAVQDYVISTYPTISPVAQAGQTLTDACHGAALAGGWWHDLKTGEDMRGKRNVGELLCLIHSEVSEAMEGNRKNLMDDKLPHRPMLEVELADAVIRIFDFAGGFNLDVAGAIAEKLEYNAHRADHKKEHRQSENGKKY